MYTAKLVAQIGDGDQEQEAVMLNRGAEGGRWLDADQRHVEVFLTELGLTVSRGSNSTGTAV